MNQDDTRRRLGKTQLRTGRLGLGTGALGGLGRAVSAETFAATIETALRNGIAYFDTAPIYGFGVSETRLGEALRNRPRSSYILSSKVGRLLREPDETPANAEIDNSYDSSWNGVASKKLIVDFSYDGALRSVEDSLERLGLDRLDVVYIHDTFQPDHYRDAMDGAYRALDRLRGEGTIGAVGVGIGRIEVLLRFALDGDFNCFLVAGRHTLLDHLPAAELMRTCLARRISVVVGGIFNSGILADPYAAEPRFDYRLADPALVEKARRIDVTCREHGVPLKAAALQFPFRHPAVASVLLGGANSDEVEEGVRLSAQPIPPALWSDLEQRGLIAPEAIR